ncbi:MAG: ROK family protein [Salinivirgaceae bacterium]|nr:ROK family protein [Salinivirgaceae bacterium]
MINPNSDNRTVLTLDAGGTNFVFSAIKGNKEVTTPFTFPAHADDLDKCLKTIAQGFDKLIELLKYPADAISFAFPGPADYDKGIIGDLPNFTAFKGGVALGPMLEDRFNLPVFINNDGNLFAYGEALAGLLPDLNSKLKAEGSIKKFKNVIGITLGTGMGCGLVLDSHLLVGDTSCGAEIHNTLNKFNSNWNAEESVSTRAIQRIYAKESGSEFNNSIMPKDIYNIAKGKMQGDKQAAIQTYKMYGEALGSSIANVVTLIDGIVVLGGGITAAWDLFSPSMFEELNRQYENFRGEKSNRLSFKIFNLEDESVFKEFANGNVCEIQVPGTKRIIKYDDMPRTAVGLSKLGGSKAIMLGAYAYALQQLDSNI